MFFLCVCNVLSSVENCPIHIQARNCAIFTEASLGLMFSTFTLSIFWPWQTAHVVSAR